MNTATCSRTFIPTSLATLRLATANFYPRRILNLQEKYPIRQKVVQARISGTEK